MRLIYSGKVLKDPDSMESCGVQENGFLVVMMTKPKKAAAVAAPAPPAVAAEAPKTPAPAAATAAATTTPAPSSSATASAPPAAPARPDAEFPSETIANLVALGFPEAEVKHCLRAAQGNPDMAVEFLTNGIPPSVSAASAVGTPSAAATAAGEPLQALRDHPQFNDLRRVVQSNPTMLQQVLTQIGQQQPELLREINANQAAFLQLMNEPIVEGASSSSTTAATTGSSSPGAAPPAMPADMSMMAGMGGADPAQMAQMMQNMDPGQLQMMAQMMGLTPDQVQAVGRMIGQLPPEQLQEYMQQAMGGGGAPGGAGGGAPGGPQVLRLSEEEMAAVDRLTEMGFDRSEAAQAFLACDKNEALAANLLMDGGFGFGPEPDAGGGGGDNMDDDEDMYS
jgi:UV excision repair protein RAD23